MKQKIIKLNYKKKDDWNFLESEKKNSNMRVKVDD